MSHARVRELKEVAVAAVKELYDLHDEVDHEILHRTLGEVIVESEYSVMALKDTPRPGEEEPPEEPEEAKPRRRVRKAKKADTEAPTKPRRGVRRGVKRKKQD